MNNRNKIVIILSNRNDVLFSDCVAVPFYLDFRRTYLSVQFIEYNFSQKKSTFSNHYDIRRDKYFEGELM